MLRKIIILSLLLSGFLLPVFAQISHGGKPLPLISMKSADDSFFEEMPAFDVAEELRLDSLNESDMRSGYKFAYKFMTNFNRANSGTSFILPDGTRVWRMGIRSKGALSINVLFTEYELPEGAKLFLYNSDQSHILGAFNHLNNSEKALLPVAPVYGDELIVEYQEPANVPFPGRLTIGEVNHGYRSFKSGEPSDTKSIFDCMLPASCYEDMFAGTDLLARSTVLLLINGTVSCSGVLVNNTANDGKPYLLTASHCLNNLFTDVNPDYEKVAETIVSFFNYDSPVCNTALRGTEEMSMASSVFRSVNEKHDMALLELKQTPPVYYRPYYAGWNAIDAGLSPYYGIHHPGGSVKRMSWFDGVITLTTYEIRAYQFADSAHWMVGRWTEGATAGGSSGSPLFDSKGHVVGGLTGGASSCTILDLRKTQDYYYSLSQAWEADPSPKRQLKYWLDPGNKGQLVWEGIDPYTGAEAFRLSNVRASGNTDSVQIATVADSDVIPLFGNNNSSATEYAEIYQVSQQAKLHGAYFVAAGTGNTGNMTVEVSVYSGNNKPETLLYRDTLRPMYTNFLNNQVNGFVETDKPLNRRQESYINFSKPVAVKGTFFVSYRIASAPNDTYFSTFSLRPSATERNTAWVKNSTGWQQALLYSGVGYATSLYIDPVISYGGDVGTESVERVSPVYIQSDREQQMLHIVLPDDTENGNCYLYTIEGKLVRSARLNNAYTSLNVSVHTPGVYVVKVFYNGVVYTQKVLF